MAEAFDKFWDHTNVFLQSKGISQELAFYIFEIAYLEGKK